MASTTDCGPDSATFDATDASSDDSSGNNRWRSNLFVPNSDLTLTGWTSELDAPAGTNLEWVVYEGSATAGPFTELARVTSVVDAADAGAAVFHESPAVSVPLTAGSSYVLAIGWDSSVTYYWTRPFTAELALGTITGAPGSSGAPPSGTLTSFTDYPNSYVAEFFFAELDGDADGEFNCTDCDDTNDASFTGAVEICDGEDNDCDGALPADESTDADSDNDIECADCDDADPLVYTGAPELCDDLDNDCNAVVDDYLETTQFNVPVAAVGPASGSVVTDTITMTTAGSIDDINIAMDLDHDDFSNLEITITSPAGTTVQLLDPSQFMGARASSDQLVFSDEGANSSLGAATAGTDLSIVPFESLSALQGEELAGVWTLTVSDTVDNDDGTLWSWAVDAFPVGYGAFECPAISCEEIHQIDVDAGDGDYWVTTLGGNDIEVACDMTTNGGGWTKVVDFDRENEGDGIAEFEANWGTFINNMGLYQEVSDAIQYQDAGNSFDALYGLNSDMVANFGDVMYDIHFEGVSMENSGVWFWVENGSGATELWCDDDATGLPNYSTTEQGYIPLTCSQTSVSDPFYDASGTLSPGGQISSVGFLGLMADTNGGDDAQLFRYEVWVR